MRPTYRQDTNDRCDPVAKEVMTAWLRSMGWTVEDDQPNAYGRWDLEAACPEGTVYHYEVQCRNNTQFQRVVDGTYGGLHEIMHKVKVSDADFFVSFNDAMDQCFITKRREVLRLAATERRDAHLEDGRRTQDEDYYNVDVHDPTICRYRKVPASCHPAALGWFKNPGLGWSRRSDMRVITISCDDYRRACMLSESMGLRSKRGGRLNGKADPFESYRIGILGEMAYARWMGIPYECETLACGDPGFDFQHGRRTVDVKTSATDYGSCLVKKTGDGGYVYTLNADAYVAAVLRWEEMELGWATMELLGYMPRSELIRQPVSMSSWGTENFCVPHAALHPMSELRQRLEAEGCLEGVLA